MIRRYDYSVFINAPFDRPYRPLFEAVVFAVVDCGFSPRCALEVSDSSQNRLEKIYRIIRDCRYGIHDLSRTALDPRTRLPRFNMPLELGVFLGAKRLGVARQRNKSCLILERERYRYREFCSDLSGQDLHAHGDDPAEAIRGVRNWLHSAPHGIRALIPGAVEMARRFREFESSLPRACRALRLDRDDLTFRDYVRLVTSWLRLNR